MYNRSSSSKIITLSTITLSTYSDEQLDRLISNDHKLKSFLEKNKIDLVEDYKEYCRIPIYNKLSADYWSRVQKYFNHQNTDEVNLSKMFELYTDIKRIFQNHFMFRPNRSRIINKYGLSILYYLNQVNPLSFYIWSRVVEKNENEWISYTMASFQDNENLHWVYNKKYRISFYSDYIDHNQNNDPVDSYISGNLPAVTVKTKEYVQFSNKRYNYFTAIRIYR
jgi:hypothetical protein